MSIEVTDEMVQLAVGIYRERYDDGTASRNTAMREALTAALDLIEEGQEEMGVWSGENPVRNAERGGAAERRREESRARLDDANTAAQGSRLTLAELRRQRKG